MNEVALNGSFSSREMDLVRRTVAKDCNDPEFDVFMHICKHTGLDPLRRQIYAFVFSKDKPDRQMVPVTAIGGFRSIAERTGNYRPDNRVPRIDYDNEAKCEKTNPLGIVRAEVSVFKYAHGDWHEAVAEAWWDEYVPIYNGEIDKRKTGWIKMPRIMLPKCAEAAAS